MGYPDWLQPGGVSGNPSRIVDWPMLASGVVIQYRGLTARRAAGGGVVLIENAAGGHSAILPLVSGTGPSSKRAEGYTMTVNPVDDEEGFHELRRLADSGALAEIYWGWARECIFVAMEGQTDFSPTWPLPYGGAMGSDVNPTTTAARAWINGDPQTAIYADIPAPSTGEVGFSTLPRAQRRSVITPALAAGDILKIRIYPLQSFVVTDEWAHSEPGLVTQSFALEEGLPGRWD